MVSFVDPEKVRYKRAQGVVSGGRLKHVGWTKGGLLVLQMLPDDMPDPRTRRRE